MNLILGNGYKTWHDDWYRDKFVDNKSYLEDDRSVNLVWISKPYNPLDLRQNAPAARSKIVHQSAPSFEKSFHTSEVALPLWGKKWASPYFASSTSTRCEEWSTLKQMLPSRGFPMPQRPPNWGTGASSPPIYLQKRINRFPLVCNPMTRFVDDMHKTNRSFSLF